METSHEAKRYTITEAAKMSGLPESTLRYYESIGIIHPIKRDEHTKRRVYSDDDINGVITVACLNATGLSIEHMKAYLVNRTKGVPGAGEQVRLLSHHVDHLRDELRYAQLRIQYVEAKIKFWQAVEANDEAGIKECATKTYVIADKMKLPKAL